LCRYCSRRAPGPIDLSNRAAAVQNPLRITTQREITMLLASVNVVLGVPLVATCIGAVVGRFRYARDEQRQQFRLFTVGAGLLSVSVVAALILWRLGVPRWFTDVLAGAGITAYAAAIAVAILRYRLYTIDVILNRTLVYGSVTVVLRVVLLVLTPLSQSAAEAWTGNRSDILPAVSGLLVALGFQPLHRAARTEALPRQRDAHRRRQLLRHLHRPVARNEVRADVGTSAPRLGPSQPLRPALGCV